MGHLTIGDNVPYFEEKDEQGTVVSSTLLLGKKYILFCYPKDDTPGCTAENCSLRDHYTTLKDMGYIIYGVSPDNEKKHLKFKDKYQLPFPLIADTEARLLSALGAWGEKSMYGKKYFGVLRSTFIVNEEGKLSHIIDKVDTKAHAEQIIALLKS
jgi:peroxiredoxin Q/BCP